MGKPFNDQGGSGLHLHVSLDRDGRNAFDDPSGDDGVASASCATSSAACCATRRR